MNSEHKKQRRDLTNETILNTPKPRASSTAQKHQTTKLLDLKKVPFSYTPNTSGDTSTESLGILSLENFQLTSCLNSTGAENLQPRFTNEKLQQQRSLANSLLEKTTKDYGLPSRYLRASDSLKSCGSPTFSIGSDSTVNESDLLRPHSPTKGICNLEREKISFTPGDISTPRSSCASNESYNPRRSLSRISMSKSLAQLSQQIKNSDTSLSELCEQFSRLESLHFSEAPEFNEESFVTGDLAIEKIIEQEQSWRRERDVLGGNSLRSDSIFSQFENHNFSTQEKSSVTEFFRKKSELADFCLKDSPEKDLAPTPLIDNSVTYESLEESDIIKNFSRHFEHHDTPAIDESALSITEIEKVIASHDSTAKIMDYMFGKPTKAKTNEKGAQKTFKSRTSDKFQSKNRDDFKENRKSHRKSLDNFKCRPSSVEPLKDSRNNADDKSSTTLHTASSLESLPGGKLPIESNRIELVWGCVPVGKRKTQTFILRNKSQNKLRLQLRSSNTNFKIVNDRSEADPVQVLPILLYPAESRLFSVSFTPSAMGAIVEKLSFIPISSELQLQQTKRQQLNLFGYGGYSNVEIQNVLKDTNMKMWLALGKLDQSSQPSQKFILRNVGTLTAFSCLRFNSKALYGYSKVTIYPTEVVLKPKEQTTVKVTYTPTKDDVKHVFATTSNQVMEIGSIQVINGEEPLRGRIRRLCKKLKQEGGVVGNPLVERLSNKFTNEKMPADLKKFNETVGCMKELMQNLVLKEIILTLERDSEQSLSGQIAGIDESSMFHSLAEGMATIISNTCLLGSCTVEPTTVVLTPPTKIEDNIILISHNVKSLQFQTSLSDMDVLQVAPSEGILSPGETSLLKISCDIRKIQQLPQQHEIYKLFIYVDDEVFEVDIKIILVKSRIRNKSQNVPKIIRELCCLPIEEVHLPVNEF